MKKRGIYLVLALIFLGSCSPNRTVPTSTSSTTNTVEPDPSELSDPTRTHTSPSTEVFLTPTPVPTYTPIPALPLGRPLELANIQMFDVSSGWGIDVEGHIVRTTDGGSSWQDVTPPQGAYEDGGFFALDSDTAWATPYQYGCYTFNCPAAPNFTTLWRTTDGGTTWQAQPQCLGGGYCGYDYAVSPEYYDPIAMQFLDDRNGWLFVSVMHLMFQDRYRLYQTTDGGSSWVGIIDNMGGPIIFSATGIAFLNPQTGWMGPDNVGGAFTPASAPELWKTLDGGFTWDHVELPAPPGLPAESDESPNWCGVVDVKAILPRILEATVRCRHGSVETRQYYFYSYRSVDGGETWSSWPRTGGVNFISPDIGWRFVASTSDEQAQLQKTTDGGHTWTAIKTVEWDDALLDFFTEEMGWAIALDGDQTALLRTIDGGHTWQDLKPVVGP